MWLELKFTFFLLHVVTRFRNFIIALPRLLMA
jgi:hypothetical protein